MLNDNGQVKRVKIITVHACGCRSIVSWLPPHACMAFPHVIRLNCARWPALGPFIIKAHDKTGPAIKQALAPGSILSAFSAFSEAWRAFLRASAEALGIVALVKWLDKCLSKSVFSRNKTNDL